MSIKLAYSTLACPDWTLAQVIDATKRYGFDGIEMRLLDGEIVPPNLAPHDRERVATECKAAGVPICCLDTSLRIASSATDADARLEAERDAAAYLELASAWGAPLIRVFGGEPQGGKSTAETSSRWPICSVRSAGARSNSASASHWRRTTFSPPRRT